MTSFARTNNPKIAASLRQFGKAIKKRGGIKSRGPGKPTALYSPSVRPKATGRTVYKSKTTIPTRRVAKPTAKKQKASSPSSLQNRNIIKNYFNKQRQALNKAAEKAKPLSASQIALVQKLKPSTTQTPRQKAIAAAKARGQAKIAAVRKRFNSLTPAQKIAMKQRQQAKALATKQRQATQKARPTKTTGTPNKPTTLRAAIAARRKAGAQAKARAGFRGRPTGRTVYKSRTTIPTRRRRK